MAKKKAAAKGRKPSRKKSAGKRKSSGGASQGVDGDLQSALEELDGVWGDADEAPDFGDIPDGRYQAKINKAEINKSKASDRLQCSFDFIIISGDCQGRHIFSHRGIETPENIGYFKLDLSKMGCGVPAKLSDLPSVLEEILGVAVEIRVKTKGDFQNVYLNRKIDVDETEEVEEEVEVEEEAAATEAETETDGEIEVGSQVSFEDEEGNDIVGEVTGLVGETADVTVGDEVYEVDISELSIEEAEEDEAEPEAEAETSTAPPEKNDTVQYNGKDGLMTGVVKKLTDNGKAVVKHEDGTRKRVALEDLTVITEEAPADGDTTSESWVGCKVKFEDEEGTELTGVVKKELDDGLTLEIEAGKYLYDVAITDVTEL